MVDRLMASPSSSSSTSSSQIDDPAQVKIMAQELNAKLAQLQSNLQRINAPNMRAMEKYEWSL